jgi:hypothetical protein
MRTTPQKNPNPFSIGKGPDALAEWIERYGLVKLAKLCGLEVNAVQRLAYLGGQPEPGEKKALDHYLGIVPSAW